LALDPRHPEASAKLGRILLSRGDSEEALELLEPLAGDFLAEGLAARARLGSRNGDSTEPGSELLERAFEAWDAGEYETALEALQEGFAAADDEQQRDLIRRAMVGIFTELGADDALAREHRRRLAAALH
jgi:thioredoxin-like negative regulator of GroEL